jgi:hypothetical protein
VIVECPQVPELIQQGFLVRTHVYAPVDPDLKGVETRVGDYAASQLAERMDRDDLVGDIVSHWHKYGQRRKTVCFAVNVKHSIHLRDEFIKSGVIAEHVDGSTPKADRDAVLARLASGETELVTNCMVLTEGWDLPDVSCVILARPTKKMGLLPTNGRSSPSAGSWQIQRNRSRPLRRSVQAWFCRGSRRMDTRPGETPNESGSRSTPGQQKRLASTGVLTMTIRHPPTRHRTGYSGSRGARFCGDH